MFHVNIYMSPFGYTMYCRKTMNTLLPVMEGEIDKYSNSTINKLCHKNDRVLLSRYQYTANAPVFSDIYGGGLREKAYIL